MMCVKCGVDLSEKPLYRTGPKGSDPKWMCEDCMTTKPDPVVKDICDSIANAR
jgi:hypothetical protein